MSDLFEVFLTGALDFAHSLWPRRVRGYFAWLAVFCALALALYVVFA